jgi:hypothetical protein
MKKIILSLACFGLCLSAFGQRDITALMVATTAAGSATNTSNGNGVIGWNTDQIAVLQCSLIQTNLAHLSTISNAVVRFDTSANGTDWKVSAYAFTLAPTGVTNAGTGYSTEATDIQRITNTVGAKWLRFGVLENVNTNRVTLSRFTISLKE